MAIFFQGSGAKKGPFRVVDKMISFEMKKRQKGYQIVGGETLGPRFVQLSVRGRRVSSANDDRGRERLCGCRRAGHRVGADQRRASGSDRRAMTLCLPKQQNGHHKIGEKRRENQMEGGISE
jgi:hypothetical protein